MSSKINRDNTVNKLGEKVRAIRKDLGLTQQQFAEKLGISRSYLGDIELGRLKGNNLKFITLLAEFTGKQMEYFIDNSLKVNSMDLLDGALDMIIKRGLTDDDGNITDEIAKGMIWDIIKKEIVLKKKKQGN